MPRRSRQASTTNIYHVMMRGNERRIIFLDDADRHHFLNILRRKQYKSDYSILAYCLMNNHVHLIIEEGHESIGQIMKRINTSYVYYFNHKYQRIGHLFQDRFRSEPIENDKYLLAAIRYIHNNPLKAGLSSEPEAFPWSSYREFLGMQHDCLINQIRILELFDSDYNKAINAFIVFSAEYNEDLFIDEKDEQSNQKNIFSVHDAQKYVNKYLRNHGKINLEDCLKDKPVRDVLIKDLKINSTLSTRVLAELLNVNRNTIQRTK